MKKILALLVAGLALLVAAAGAQAAAPVFGAPETVGTGPVADTHVAVDREGDTALVWRTAGSVVGAVRRGDDQPWAMRVLETDNPSEPARDVRVAMMPDGAAVAIWSNVSGAALMVAIADPGQGFGSAHLLSRLRDGFSADSQTAVLAPDRVLVVWRDGISPHGSVLDHVVGATGPTGPTHTLRRDEVGLGLDAAPAAHGAVAVFASHVACIRLRPHHCPQTPSVLAVAVDAVGRSVGEPLLVADAFTGRYGSPRVATDAAHTGVVSWLNGPTCMTRQVRTDPLRLAGPAITFPNCGGPGQGTADVALAPGDLTVGAAVTSTPGIGAGASAAVVANGHWTSPQALSSRSPWTTVPALAVENDGTLAVFASASTVPGPALYQVYGAWRPAGGDFGTAVPIGGPFATLDARGVSVATNATDSTVVAWPQPLGGVGLVVGH
jgi:hypothetical protein